MPSERSEPQFDSASFADGILAYLQTNVNYDAWDKEQAILEVANLMCNDIAAAQLFLDTIGVGVNLYDE